MGSKDRKEAIINNQKVHAQAIVNYVLDEVENDSKKIGVLLCEGDENSIDKLVYSAVFPDLVIVPLGSCTTVMRILNRVKKLLASCHLYAFGIIDRDALSKPEIKKMKNDRGVYTTKLPFIENIVCAPEMISHLCEDMGLNYEETLEKINEQLMKILWQKFKEALPINLGIDKKERIESLQIGAHTKKKDIEKVVNRDNILYAYRSKVILSIVANELHLDGRKGYCEKIKQMLADENHHESLVKVFASFIPLLETYDFEEIT